MEVICRPAPLWTVIRCRHCAADPKGPPSANVCSSKGEIFSNHHLVDVYSACDTSSLVSSDILSTRSRREYAALGFDQSRQMVAFGLFLLDF